MSTIRVPESDLPLFRAVLDLSPSELDAIRLRLEAWKSVTADEQAIASEMVSAGLDMERARQLADLLDSLHGVFAWKGDDLIAYVDELCLSLATDYATEDWINETALNAVREKLRVLLSIHPIFAAYKAGYLADQFERVYLKAKIFSDIRPVFDQSVTPDASPLSAIIVHSLNIAFNTTSGFQEIYLSAKEEDLKELRTAIDRALTKMQVMQDLIKRAGVPSLASVNRDK